MLQMLLNHGCDAGIVVDEELLDTQVPPPSVENQGHQPLHPTMNEVWLADLVIPTRLASD